jgi:hypothetical protein
MNRQARRGAGQGTIKTETWGAGRDYLLARKVMCPYCGLVMNGIGHPGHRHAPEPGSLSVCIRCAGVCELGPDLGLLAIDPADLARYRAEDPDLDRDLARLVSAVREVAAAVGPLDRPDPKPEKPS